MFNDANRPPLDTTYHFIPLSSGSDFVSSPSYEIVFRFNGDRFYDFKNIVTNQMKRDVSWWSIEISAVTYCNVNIYYNFMYKQLCLELNYVYRINNCELLDSYNIRRTTLVYFTDVNINILYNDFGTLNFIRRVWN